MGTFGRSFLCLCLCACLVFGAGFLLFCYHILHLESPHLPGPQAGIVVLTGGPQRLETGLTLLKNHQGLRLLVSGVHKDVRRPQILPNPSLPVDLGYSAQNTIENAREAKDWASQHHFGALILVTSKYHLPRARLEFAQRLGEIAIYPYPAQPPTGKEEPFLLPLAWKEYTKYTLALVRAGARFIAINLGLT
ncbi:MAG: YdcF family protein [Proteobacteria bacterium]|nr:YdcF family protein [Pseudomonadota bacterium]